MLDDGPRPDAAVPPAVLAGNTGFLIGKVHERARDRFEQALAPLGLRVRHYGALAALDELGPVTQSALGERLRVDRSTMVAVVDELEVAGRVLRRRDPQDRRAYRLELTADGQAVLRRAVAVVGQVLDDVLAPLTQRQRRDLHGTLEVLLRHLGP